ncbi:hypothetical protein CesoFtcFv8_015287 [Champsocephalus esox]|uniref:MAM domain-containing protein n=1 Tax=Champsocephalus esox TaxID=159716 RepID=A0AAN8BPW0_9TELE|nr:hypothetical protein CesoFtcFv8_015287 [Champsocephalus esox]
MKQICVLLSVLLVVVSSCPDGGFNCTSGECLPARLVCNFKKDCEDGSDELFCGSCDFEHHSCGWNSSSRTASYRWRRQMANITSVPGLDHSTGNASGHVMHVAGEEGHISSTAYLEYFVDNLAALGCQISFWYYLYNNSSSSSSSLNLNMIRSPPIPELLHISKSKTDGWEKATALIGNQPGGYKLEFSFKPPYKVAIDVMLDDVMFENCAEGDVPAGSHQLSCDFEEDTCSWYHDRTASLLWRRENGAYSKPTGKGYFMLISAKNNLNISSAARLISFPRPEGHVTCVSFLYHIFGNSIGSLKFITKLSGEEETVVWMRSGTQGNKWRFADLTFDSGKPIQFIIEAVVGGTQGSIAIDDLKVYSETDSCPAERECTFQGSLCGMLPRPFANSSWSRSMGGVEACHRLRPSHRSHSGDRTRLLPECPAVEPACWVQSCGDDCSDGAHPC